MPNLVSYAYLCSQLPIVSYMFTIAPSVSGLLNMAYMQLYLSFLTLYRLLPRMTGPPSLLYIHSFLCLPIVSFAYSWLLSLPTVWCPALIKHGLHAATYMHGCQASYM